MDRPGRVIVGVSGSPGNIAAVHAAAFAAAQTGRTLVAVNAWHPVGGEAVARRSPCAPLDNAVREQAWSILSEALASIRRTVDIERLVLRGPVERILLATANHADDLLVVGTGRQGALARLTHGTVTRYCVAHARCAVLAVPPPELASDLKELEGRRHMRAISIAGDAEGQLRGTRNASTRRRSSDAS
jgi:nucleotide-binding universal stress UspA family protein